MTTIKLRRDHQAAWESQNPVLSDGEPGLNKDNGKIKIGNGLLSWNDLPYSFEGYIDQAAFNEHIYSEDPHPNVDDGRSFLLLYENAKV